MWTTSTLGPHAPCPCAGCKIHWLFPGTTLANHASRLLAQSQVRGVALPNELRNDSWRASPNVHFSPRPFSLVGQLGNLALSAQEWPTAIKSAPMEKWTLLIREILHFLLQFILISYLFAKRLPSWILSFYGGNDWDEQSLISNYLTSGLYITCCHDCGQMPYYN